MKKNSTEEAMTFTLQSQPSPHRSLSSCIVKNAPIDDINIMNVPNTFAITAIDEHQGTEYPTVLTGIIEVGDFNHSGGYCYELFFSSTCVCHAFHFSFLFTNYMHFPRGWHAFIYVSTSFLPYGLHVFTARRTPVLYLFKSVVERLYSVAIHWEFYCS